MPRPPILPVIDWKELWNSAKSYSEWLDSAENKDHAEAMEQGRRGLPLTPEQVGWLKAAARPVHVVAIAEDWCGDVVRHVPVLQRLADESPNVEVRYISREQRPDIFARYLTNGGEAIPKFVFLSNKFIECGNWGPMPDACRRLVARGKGASDVGRAREKVSKLYEADPERHEVTRELMELIDTALTITP